MVAQRTVFGWVLSGQVSGVDDHKGGCQLLCLGDIHESALRRLWSLEGVGVTDVTTGDESDVMTTFESTVERSADGRYVVKLPWKEGAVDLLQDNRASAEKRLTGLGRKLERDPDLRACYDGALCEMEGAGVITEVPVEELVTQNPTFYLPHRPVVKESSTSTKVRPVFDASARGPNGVSLNDCLEVGPCLLPNLLEVLLRFRRWPFAVTADITKAFLQVGLSVEDQDTHRFLWDCDGRVRVMKSQRVIFGVSSSPFLLSATIRHHLSLYPDSPAIREMRENFYVDDLLSGANSESEASALLSEAQRVMRDAHMMLTKCRSNSPLLFDKAQGVFGESEHVKVLGVIWNPTDDLFAFQGVSLPDDIVPTKCVVLSFVARMFDPLGFISPFVMTLKSLFQELWQLGLHWDDPLPESCRDVCPRGGDVCSLGGDVYRAGGDVSTPVCSPGGTVRTPVCSPGCAVCTPVCSPGGAVCSSGGAACSPGGAVRTPGAAVCSPGGAVCSPGGAVCSSGGAACSPGGAVRTPVCSPGGAVCSPGGAVCSSGGAACSPGGAVRTPVCSPGWAVCSPGAAVCSPGATLCTPDGAVCSFDEKVSDPITEEMVEVESFCLVTSQFEEVFPVERWGKMSKAVRVAGWVRRFIRNCRVPADRCSLPDLTTLELADARLDLLRQEQRKAFSGEWSALEKRQSLPKGSRLIGLDPFIADDRLLRVRGRLEFSDLMYEEKHPILLPKCHLAVLLAREQHVLLKHAGVSTMMTSLRGAYWILGLRCIAKGVKRGCVSCLRHDSRPFNEEAAPLPGCRVTQSPPFTVTVVDFGGPLFSVDFPRKKFYVCLFTCAVTRAVHLEMTDALSLPAFMLALRRFSARRGLPRIMYSDNAPTFRGADKQLQRVYSHLAPEWRFIVPHSPWWGGWWERLIRSVKVGLRKSLGSRCLSRDELETVLLEVECCVNSRPLTFVGDGLDSSPPITPAHFLTGRGTGFSSRVVEDPACVNAKALTERARACEKRLARFWSVWYKEYVRTLPPSVRRFRPQGKLSEGSMVMLQEDNVPRMRWVHGVVTRLITGRDGKVRSAEVRTPSGLKTRPIQRLFDLDPLSSEP
ncbi:uncharacterized protein LOC122368878 [Amphibalanus amphitrite]|uniref:uncharacterized protein LOC122368878 n=1 Tax=Amphibalanus amphitrite TaxID=1232801 RepID=UPI001C8FEABB|nr:uncharacterized protein LOC122368878 [Amphibalanus amphitrite]